MIMSVAVLIVLVLGSILGIVVLVGLVAMGVAFYRNQKEK